MSGWTEKYHRASLTKIQINKVDVQWDMKAAFSLTLLKHLTRYKCCVSISNKAYPYFLNENGKVQSDKNTESQLKKCMKNAFTITSYTIQS